MSRDPRPLRADFLLFFRLPEPGAVSRRSRVLTCFLGPGATSRGGTTHVLRFSRRWSDDGSNRDACCAATEKLLWALRPSSATIGRNVSTWSRESEARVRSRTRGPLATSAAAPRSGRGGPSTAPGAGERDLYAPWRAMTQGMPQDRARLAGSAPRGPGRRQAHPRPSLSVGSTSPSRCPAAAWAPGPRRPEATTSCPLGKRVRAWRS